MRRQGTRRLPRTQYLIHPHAAREVARENETLPIPMGADHVVDYTREDFARNGKQYDLILDVVARRSIFAYGRALGPNGRYFLAGGSVATMLQVLLLGPWIRATTGKNLRILAIKPEARDLIDTTELYEAGQVVPVIDRRYTLSEVPEALRYLGEGRTRGKVVITV